MTEYVKGAAFARDSILELIDELKEMTNNRFAPWAVEASKVRLQRVYDEISTSFGELGSNDFIDAYMYQVPTVQSFTGGVEYAKNRLLGYLGVEQGRIGHANKFLVDYQTLQWLINTIEDDFVNMKAEINEKMVSSLAVKLNDFYKDFDYYDYMDKTDGDEPQAIDELVEQLGDQKASQGIVDALKEIKENSELDEKQVKVVDGLIRDVILVVHSLGKSVDDVLVDASLRIKKELAGNTRVNEELTIDK